MAYGVVVILGAVAYVDSMDPRFAATVATAALAALLPRALGRRRQSDLSLALCVDAVTALVLWWLLGPVAGLGVLLFLVAGVAGVALPSRSALSVGLVAVLAEAAQIPLHFLAVARGGLPLFHPPGQVVTASEFLAASLIRVSVLILTVALFARIGRSLRDSHWRLRDSEEGFRRVFEDAPVGVGLVDSSGMIVRANRRLSAVFPLLEENVSVAVLDDSPAEPVCGLLKDVLSARLETGEITVSPEAGRHARVSISAIEGADGTPAQVVMHAEDVTEQHEAARRLEELVRSKDEFVAAVSHEIRTPLTAVVGFSEVLRDSFDLVDNSQLREIVGDIARESVEVASIVDDLLVIARADIDKVALFPELVALDDAVSSVVATTPLGEHDFRCEMNGLSVLADPVRIRQILRNLLTNAVRYGGRAIEVSAREEDGVVAVTVADNGVGVPATSSSRIFGAYERAHEKGTQPASVGLGLTVARSLARAMGGDLHYLRREGWTVFELRLPTSPADRVSPSQATVA